MALPTLMKKVARHALGAVGKGEVDERRDTTEAWRHGEEKALLTGIARVTYLPMS